MNDKRDQYTTEQIIEALYENAGVTTNAAGKLGINRNTLSKWISNEPELQQAKKDSVIVLFEEAKNSALKLVKENNVPITIFLLKTLGKNEGFAERVEQSGPDGSPIQIDNLTEVQKEIKKLLKKNKNV